MQPGLAAKAFIVNEQGKLLIIKRRDNDVQKPSTWDFPGGRLALGESPFDGLKRETKEETCLDIEIMNPLRVHHFTRDDGQKITMVNFLCRPLSNDIKLSEEHTEYEWAELDKAFSKIHPSFKEDIEIFKNYFTKKD